MEDNRLERNLSITHERGKVKIQTRSDKKGGGYFGIQQ